LVREVPRKRESREGGKNIPRRMGNLHRQLIPKGKGEVEKKLCTDGRGILFRRSKFLQFDRKFGKEKHGEW